MELNSITKSSLLNSNIKFNQAYDSLSLSNYNYFDPIRNSGVRTEMNGKKLIHFSAMDYLSFTQDARVIEAGREALKQYGSGCSSSMPGGGNLQIHSALCEELADFLHKESVMLLPTGYQAQYGFSSFNIINGGKIFADNLDHSSIIDGIAMGLGNFQDKFGRVHYFMHNSYEHFQSIHCDNHIESMYDVLFIEGTYSMDGDYPDLEKFTTYCNENNILIAVDEAHSMGVFGDHGRGITSAFKLTDDVDFILGTFSKSFANIGGYIAGKKEHIDFMKVNMNTYLFSASITPPTVEMVRCILKILRDDDSKQIKLWENIKYMQQCCKQSNIDIGNSDSSVFPIYIRDSKKTIVYAKKMLEKGIFVKPIIFPAVKTGQERIRVTMNAGHSKNDIDSLIDAFNVIRKEIELVKVEDLNYGC